MLHLGPFHIPWFLYLEEMPKEGEQIQEQIIVAVVLIIGNVTPGVGILN